MPVGAVPDRTLNGVLRESLPVARLIEYWRRTRPSLVGPVPGFVEFRAT